MQVHSEAHIGRRSSNDNMAEDKRDALPDGGSSHRIDSLPGWKTGKTYCDGVDSGAVGKIYTTTDDTCYPATNKWNECFIFNITGFHCPQNYNRAFDNETDVEELTQTLQSLGFVCTVHRNTTAKQTCEALERLASDTDLLMKRDGFLCWIITYGKEHNLYASDGILDFDDIVRPFTGDKCPGLFGKPKLFFVQAMNDSAKSFWSTDAMGAPPAEKDAGTSCRIPAMADFYFAFSSAPGFFETADDKNPSHFINIVNKVLKEKVTEDGVELSTLMNYVVDVSSDYFKKEKKSEAACYQLPCVMSTLTRDVLFYSYEPVQI